MTSAEASRVWEAALLGYEDHYTVGVFESPQQARDAAATAMRAARRYHRDLWAEEPDRPLHPHLRARVIEHRLNAVDLKWWER